MVLVDPSLLVTVLQTIGLSAWSERPVTNLARQEPVSHPHNAAQAIAAAAPHSNTHEPVSEKVPMPFARMGNNLAFPPTREYRLGRLSRRYAQYDGADIPLGNEPVDLGNPSTTTPSASSETPTSESVAPQEVQPTSTATEDPTGSERIHALGADDTCPPPANVLENAPGDVPLPPLPSPNPSLATIYRYRQQQGVNLGSWFLLESWMVPSLFGCASSPAAVEFDVATGWNGQAKAVLENHWDTFITESDFEWLASVGINTVRLPLGYWHIGTGDRDWMQDTMYASVKDQYDGAWPRVLRSISWAEKYGLGVLVDLHGAPGSQNGRDHSGVSDGQVNLFYSPDNIRKTISVLQFLTDTLIDVPNVVGIQMLNEPVNVPELWDFYNTALNSLRGSSPKAQNYPFYFHDAFDVDRGVDFMRNRGKEWNVLDYHSYFVFTPEDIAESAMSHITDVTLNGAIGSKLMNAGMSIGGNIIVGEWSCALSDTSLSTEESPISARRQFCETQQDTYQNTGAGFTFWSFTKENCDQDSSWCFKNAVNSSLPGSFFSFEGLTVDRDLDSAVNLTSHTTATVHSDGEAGTHPLPTSIQPISWAAVSSLSSTSIPLLTTSVNVAAQTSSLPLEPTPQSTSVEEYSSSHDAQATPEVKFHADTGRRWNKREHRSTAIHKRRIDSNERRQDQTIGPAAPINKVLQDVAPSSISLPTTTVSGATLPTGMSVPSVRPHANNTTTTTPTVQTLTPAEEAIQRGFSDGFMTARLFAQQGPGMSRLGFKAQYVEDSLAAHGPNVIRVDKEELYREWFEKGLVHGEGMVQKVIARMNVV